MHKQQPRHLTRLQGIIQHIVPSKDQEIIKLSKKGFEYVVKLLVVDFALRSASLLFSCQNDAEKHNRLELLKLASDDYVNMDFDKYLLAVFNTLEQLALVVEQPFHRKNMYNVELGEDAKSMLIKICRYYYECNNLKLEAFDTMKDVIKFAFINSDDVKSADEEILFDEILPQVNESISNRISGFYAPSILGFLKNARLSTSCTFDTICSGALERNHINQFIQESKSDIKALHCKNFTDAKKARQNNWVEEPTQTDTAESDLSTLPENSPSLSDGDHDHSDDVTAHLSEREHTITDSIKSIGFSKL